MGTDPRRPTAPAGLQPAGLALWEAVTEVYDLEEHERALLIEAARTVDLLDQLDAAVRRDGALVVVAGVERAHPAAVEARAQRIALARLVAALRLPAGEEGDQQQGARQPQRRVGVRGVYAVGGSAG